ncbi:MAG: hypothetical protein JXB26_16115 [Candidatus Aminicenantes bacterium]|nr:hypothetical protein [Candidatus Aminicenantes bacterium]
MTKRTRLFSIIPVFMFLCLIPARVVTLQEGASSINKDDESLETILEKCAEYSDKLIRSSLDFICREEIEEKIFDYTRRKGKDRWIEMYHESQYSRKYRGISLMAKSDKYTYIYDYQLVKKGNSIKESRILLEENGEKKNEKDASLKTKRFYSKRSVFGPIGLLSRKGQEQYEYELSKKDKEVGREAYLIEVRPKSKEDGKIHSSFGKVWVDRENFSILKIEVKAESIQGYDQLKDAAKREQVIPEIMDIHYYGVEKNGLRFPSKTIIEENYRAMTKVIKKSRTVVEYKDYRFFTVDVDVKY